MSLYLLYPDVHAGKAPSSCTESYWDDLLDLLDQTVTVAGVKQVQAVIIAGDVFHSKAPNRTSHRIVQQLIAVLKLYECPVYIVPGNHDIRNDRLESINETQPLGVLFRSGAARELVGWADGMWQDSDRREYGMMPLYGVPWQQEWTDEAVQLALSDYYHAGVVACRSAPALVIAHAPLYPPGKELKWENYPVAQWAAAMGGWGSCFYGHVHEPHGVWTVDGVQYCNNGALSRGSLHEYNLTRQVGVTLWDDKTGEFEFVPLDAKPASEVFRLQEKQQVTDMQGRLDQFLADMDSTQLAVVSVESVTERVRQMGLGKDAEDLIEELLAGALHAQGGPDRGRA